MTRLAACLSVTVVAAGFAVPTVQADPVRIISGSLIWSGGGHPGGGDVTLVGQQGFTFEGGTSHSGIFLPVSDCAVPECAAGTTVDLLARWGGLDIPGTATFAGTTYTVGSLADTSAHLQTEWTGSLTIPAGFTGGALSAAFLFSGFFAYPEGPNNILTSVPLTGSGTARLTFTPYEGSPGFFTLASAQYDFETAPVPEPSTFMLVGFGAAALARRARARHRRETARAIESVHN